LLGLTDILLRLLDSAQVVVRGPKPATVLHSRKVRIDGAASDPFTTREVLAEMHDRPRQPIESRDRDGRGIEGGVPTLVEAREVIAAFHAIIRRKAGTDIAAWIDHARKSLVASFANGIAKDEAAVRAAIISPWSNGQTEGQITKLKLVKRQMYGRAKIDLLQARLIGAS
jgi:hypothetical protein